MKRSRNGQRCRIAERPSIDDSAKDELAMLIPATVRSAGKRPRSRAVSVTTAMEAPGLMTRAAATTAKALKLVSSIGLEKRQEGLEGAGAVADRVLLMLVKLSH